MASLLVIAACGVDQSPTAPSASDGLAVSASGHTVVNSLADPGNGVCNAAQCTLREAISDPATTQITFAPGLTGTITLAPPGSGGGRLEIDRSLSITGPSQRIAISGQAPGLSFPVVRIGPDATVTLANLVIQNGGIGILNRGTLTVTNSVATENSTGISSRFGTLALINSLVIGNTSAGVDVVHGTAALLNDRIAGNSRSGIHIFNATVTVNNSTVARNSAENGGGILNDSGQLSISHCTITNNIAADRGGGIFNTVDDAFRRQGATVTMVNSTISGNSAGSGGGISNSPEKSSVGLTLTNSTIARNTAIREGGGIFQLGQGEEDEAFLSLRNALVAQNSAPAGPDVFNGDRESGFVFARFNLITDGTGSGITNTDGNRVGNVAPRSSPINPRIGALADNGGPTRTHALLAGSPAIGGASAEDCPPTDQRGVSRPQGAACDIGSYERE